ncbi:hypothetical protein ABZS53_15285 [Streptomyces sp. NPDC005499]|uniref:hypothetical protein n=1 Tax=Streptomyces sp. NPDC005499 TaxID=3154883 RepID=UPI0033B9732F
MPVDASALAKRVTLAPADWNSGYKRAAPYESADLTEGVTDAKCKYSIKPVTNALGGRQRNVQSADETVYVTSELIVFKQPAAAHQTITRFRRGTMRCRTVEAADDKSQWKDVHEVEIPKKGFDEVAAEEAHQVLDATGQTMDAYYIYAYGRKGQYLMEAYVARSGSGTQEQNRHDAVAALTLMLSRL